MFTDNADVRKHERAIEFFRDSFGKFSFASSFNTVKEKVQAFTNFSVLEHVERQFYFRIAIAKLLERNSIAFINSKIEAVQIVARMTIQEHADALGNVEVFVKDAHLLERTLVRNGIFEVDVWIKLRENVRKHSTPEPAGTDHIQKRTALFLVEENPREHHDFHFVVGQIERLLHDFKALVIRIVHVFVLFQKAEQFTDNAIVEYLLRLLVENAFAAQVIAHEIRNFTDRAGTVNDIVESHDSHLTALVGNAHFFALFVAAEPLASIISVRFLDKALFCMKREAIFFGIELFEMFREVFQHAGGTFFGDDCNAVVGIRVAFANPHHANPVFIALERHKIEFKVFAGAFGIQGI